eukprot:999890-Rhodomonas_salina.2
MSDRNLRTWKDAESPQLTTHASRSGVAVECCSVVAVLKKNLLVPHASTSMRRPSPQDGPAPCTSGKTPPPAAPLPPHQSHSRSHPGVPAPCTP